MRTFNTDIQQEFNVKVLWNQEEEFVKLFYTKVLNFDTLTHIVIVNR